MISRIILLLLCSTVIVKTQAQFYFNAGIRYFTPLTYQEAPEYFTAAIIVPASTGNYFTEIITYNPEFSLANGFSYGGSIGYRINEHIGIQTSLHYFQEKQELKSEDIAPHYPIGSTSWQFRSFNITPSLVISQSAGRFSIHTKAGLLLGLSSMGKSVFFDHFRKTFKFNTSMSTGYSIGLELSYSLNDFMAFYIETGVENQFYKPRKAILRHDDFTYWDMDELPVYLKEIIYVRKVDQEPVHYDSATGTYFTDHNKPLMRMKEAIKLNGFYTGAGIKLELGNK